MTWNTQDINLSWYVPKANVDHTISGQGTAFSTLDHLATTPRAMIHWSSFLKLLAFGAITKYIIKGGRGVSKKFQPETSPIFFLGGGGNKPYTKMIQWSCFCHKFAIRCKFSSYLCISHNFNFWYFWDPHDPSPWVPQVRCKLPPYLCISNSLNFLLFWDPMTQPWPPYPEGVTSWNLM